jgi:hypothetical protein
MLAQELEDREYKEKIREDWWYYKRLGRTREIT